MPNKEIFEPYLDEDERIVFRCSVQRRLVLLFRVLSVICLVLAAGWIPFMIRGINNAPEAYEVQRKLLENNPDAKIITPAAVILVSVGIFVLFLAAALFCFFYARSLGRRVYLLTDRRLFCSKGGVISNSRRILDLSDVHGVERNQNLFTLIFDACSINFYSPSAAMTRSKFLFLFSRSTFRFSLFGVATEEAEKFISLYLKTGKTAVSKPSVQDAQPEKTVQILSEKENLP